MRTDRLAVGGAVLAVVLVAVLGVAVRGAADRARSTPPPAPTSLTVACTPDGITLSGSLVAAGSAGVTLEVSSTLPGGSTLGFDIAGYRDAEELPTTPATWVRPVPPGEVELICSVDGRPQPGMSARVEVVDPGGHWRAATLGDAGCTMTGGRPIWKFGPQAGDTAQQAVDALLAVVADDGARPLAVRDAGLGYPDAPTQTWVAVGADGRGFTIDVVRGEAGFEAVPRYLCAGRGKP